MTNLTISLNEDTVRRLRKYVQERYNSKKGALSGVIEESIKETLDSFFVESNSAASQIFRAVKDNETLAEGATLNELATKLRKMKIDPRSVRIQSSRTLAPVARAGLRGRITS